MEKLKMQTKNIADENFYKLAKLFPNAVTETTDENGNVVRAIDKDILMQEISVKVVDGKEERYQFTWPDKKKAIINANAPINKTLRPCRSESVNFDTTQNLYIEGDNLEVLKLLQETYLNKIKMIYIDPPYNTGNDFVYNDDFRTENLEFREKSGNFDTEGNLLTDRMTLNTESNGRFHTDWLNMMYPRLKLARDLLSDDGVIFISIDDNEVENLKKICNEIFGASNFIAQIIVEGTPKNDPKIISTAHEYCLVYVKNFDIAKEFEWGINNPIYEKLLNLVKTSETFEEAEQKVKMFYKDNNLSDDNISNYNKVDKKGLYRIGPIDDPQGGGARDIRYNPYTNEPLKTPNRGWGCSKETWNDWVKNDEILFPEDNSKLCSRKVYVDSKKLDLLRAYFKIQTRKDTDMLKTMFGKKVFSYPKPLELIKKIIDASVKGSEIVLDFFSGSATTAHAVMELNLNRLNNGITNQIHYILVQLQENLYENLKSAKGNREKQTCQNAIDFCVENGFEVNLTSIGKERIRRSGSKIIDEMRKNGGVAGVSSDGKAGCSEGETSPLKENGELDIGFRVLKVDSSNMKDVFYSPEEVFNNDLFQDNIKADRTGEDLLFAVMLDLGIMLSSKIERRDIDGKSVYFVEDNYLVACFDEGLTEETITKIAKQKPYYFVMRDSSAANDSVITNFDQIFETFSSETIRKVL